MVIRVTPSTGVSYVRRRQQCQQTHFYGVNFI
jgi:hypothetical protein